MNRGIISLLVMIALVATGVNAQSISSQVITSAGGDFEKGAYYLSFTTAQIASQDLNQQGILLTQGFQQGYLLRQPVANSPYTGVMNVYPNPATDHIKLVAGFNEEGKMTIKVVDMLGRDLISLSIPKGESKQTQVIDVSKLRAGIYFVRAELVTDTGVILGSITKISIEN